MSLRLAPCPYLPMPPEHMDASTLTAHGSSRDAAFYLTALTYAQYLWQRGFSARAILKLDRALGADLGGQEDVLTHWPLPYRAMSWILRHAPADTLVGNPRVHFQHLADRMNEPRRDQRRWRAWACWQLTRVILPHLPADPKHEVREPDEIFLRNQLLKFGIPGEADLWQSVLEEQKLSS